MKKKILFHLGHPAHFHLFRNSILHFQKEGYKTYIIIKKKDVLEDLVKNSGMQYYNILPDGRKDSLLFIALGILKQTWKLSLFCIKNRPSILLGSTPNIAHVGFLLRIKSINLSEDDAKEVSLYSNITYPFTKTILSPVSCDNGKWNSKTIKYESYHELAYLHPNNFKPNREIVEKIVTPDKPFFILRFSKLNAYHDKGINGINNEVAEKIINYLHPFGKVLITSEKSLPNSLEKYRISINPLDMHHYLAFAHLYIGDSQTMAAEAGVLGTPFIRVNDFVGKLGYLNEIELKYGLGFGIKPENIHEIFGIMDTLLSNNNLSNDWDEKRQRLLKDKIDFNEFLIKFITKSISSKSI